MTQPLTTRRHFDLEDGDLSLLKGRRIAILGYGNQGHAHALNLRDSGMEVVVGLRKESRYAPAAREAGFEVRDFASAAKGAFLVMLLLPDELHAGVYAEQLRGVMDPDAYLAFSHGFAVAFDLIELEPERRVLLVAPKGQGHALRASFQNGGGLPGLIGAQGPKLEESLRVALAYARACGALGGGGFASSFREEAVSDLFGEQTVLCGGLIELITAAWELLVARGYSAEGAYFECLHEVKIITDLVHRKGVDGMREGISPTAAYGGLRAGPRVIGKESRAAMEELLDEIEDGRFARAFLEERAAGSPWLTQKREEETKHPMQETGRGLRAFLERCRLGGPSRED